MSKLIEMIIKATKADPNLGILFGTVMKEGHATSERWIAGTQCFRVRVITKYPDGLPCFFDHFFSIEEIAHLEFDEDFICRGLRVALRSLDGIFSRGYL